MGTVGPSELEKTRISNLPAYLKVCLKADRLGQISALRGKHGDSIIYFAVSLRTRFASDKAAFNSFVRRSASAMISGAISATLSG